MELCPSRETTWKGDGMSKKLERVHLAQRLYLGTADELLEFLRLLEDEFKALSDGSDASLGFRMMILRLLDTCQYDLKGR